MFENVGEKIKVAAMVLCALGIVASLILACVFFSGYFTRIYGFILLIAGPIGSWISALVMYGMGQAIDDIHVMRQKNNTVLHNQPVKEVSKETVAQTPVKKQIDNEEYEKQLLKKSDTVVKTDNMQRESKKEPEDTSNALFCPGCNERLDVMGYTESDFGKGEICPICGVEF